MLIKLLRMQRQVLADRRGASALEAAIVLPIFFTFALGVIEFGFVLYAHSFLQSAATIVARDIAVNAVDIGQAQADFDQRQPGWMSGTTVTAIRMDTGNSKLTTVNVQVSVPARLTTPIKIITGMFAWTLTANVSAKQELPFNS